MNYDNEKSMLNNEFSACVVRCGFCGDTDQY
jgi:hypothetical protein